MIKKLLFISALVFLISHCIAQQTFNELNANNINCSVTATGDLFNRFQSDLLAGFEVPAGSDLRTIYAANLWVAGIYNAETFFVSAETYQLVGHDWFTGPLSIDGNATVSTAAMEAYNQVWEANTSDIEIHMSYFQSLQDGTTAELFPDGYEIPAWIVEWPVHGNTSENQAYILSQFYDNNDDGTYTPEAGDYPLFCGDECLYFIFNDKGGVHTESGGFPTGLEIHGMLYAFNSTNNDMLGNTVFLRYEIINRGTYTLSETYVGLWADFDIGNATDDYVGTNVKRSAVYGYNGDGQDEANSNSPGYQDDIPMQALQILAGPVMDENLEDDMLPDMVYSSETNSYGAFAFGFGDGIVDNERLGLSSSLYYNNGINPISGEPGLPIDFFNYLRHTWKDGSICKHGGNGVSGAGVEEYESTYFFPDESDPLHLGTDGLEASLWNEVTATNPSGDRRMLGTCGPFELLPGEINFLDAAFVFAQVGSLNISVEELMDERLKEAKLFWNENLENCEFQSISLEVEKPLAQFISIYPNPAKDILSISTPTAWNNVSLELYDVRGNLIRSISISGGINQISVEDLSAGTYAVKVQCGDHLLTQKIIVQ
ncbi:MAG: T9SS type A sorting domain-containing protein [Flavobacteriales bacterium]